MRKHIRRGDPQRRSYWEEVVRRWEQGGRSVREFCRAEGLRESALYFWRRKLGRGRQASDTTRELTLRASSGVDTSMASRLASGRRRGPASFVPVRVVEGREALASDAVEIVLAGGRTVRVRGGFDRQTLADVLAVLEARPC